MGLQVGDSAPAFSAKDQDGNEVKLSDFKGEKVILYFYPKDDTPSCTAQACNLRDNYDVLLKKNYKVLGVSADDEKSHQKFIKKFNLPFPLLADTDQKIVNDYGVWALKKTFGHEYMGIVRTTFVIDENGIIEEVVQKVNTKNHTDQILNKSE
ncbi:MULTISPECIES: thioredoxin-dependent thiol peroxidase [Dyadobacter]|uniref:thioredoxin-dependent peroxiredoxin n=1 Tax=Dyadobacter chenhuakuii TaxID=2909339 RepID=A0A9X1QIJ7_9BACT|nr:MULTISPECIES: thioredoxin-dependent thiol peroxidase [Dyadobacter]MCE7071574.1 thioredoxin-dependent thiol peroxidase [Dyadobacter sp. CY327]MCF2493535.1 thioredoxin-dependent thiol peroxidase [Dyadobacter chenhuakuii]MCF2500957.1 thioredoxin-dependent thiol peroxidase [Dyadobacter chenhuakuii]USJ30675.1 thioredoxin-dependent thiol peroxidase [Dyadobacter chenhuakuii]